MNTRCPICRYWYMDTEDAEYIEGHDQCRACRLEEHINEIEREETYREQSNISEGN